MRTKLGAVADRLRLRRFKHTPPSPELPEIAWFDAPGAANEIDDRAATDADRAILASWVDHGYAIAEQLVPHELIDEMTGDLDRLFTGDEIVDGLAINDALLADGLRATISHGDLMALPRQHRLDVRDRSNWRVHAFYQRSRAADAIRELPELRRIASMILGLDSRAHYSINFHNGSTQALHEDSAVFHLGVPNLICGAWVACEDVHEGSGPLLFFPGSHRRAMFARFEHYPATNLMTATPDVATAYRRHVDLAADRFEPETFLARRGDVLFWHGMLIHGGEPIRHRELTRKSYVVHFIPTGADVGGDGSSPAIPQV